MLESQVAIHFRDMDASESLRELVSRRCEELGEEFPEVGHIEVTLSPDGDGHVANGHVTGRHVDIALHASGGLAGHAADKLLDKLRHQLRRDHDKRIFSRRRDAQKHNKKRA
jgi:ribosome-associated translation inhibitor RaiA